MSKLIRVSTCLLFFLLLGGILHTSPSQASQGSLNTASGVPMIENPSAHYCLSQGFAFQTQETGSGEEGLCVFPDGRACDAWDFLAGKCGQEQNYCASQDLTTKVLSDGQNPYSREYAVCTSEDGQEVGKVTELMNFKEELVSPGCDSDSTPPQPSPEAISSTQGTLHESFTSVSSIPGTFDWRDNLGGDWMTPVKNQGTCGSCWAFSAVGAVEAHLNLINNNPGLDPDLSEEYLVSDCSWSGTCCGGWHSPALEFIKDYGIPDEDCLPYVDGQDCSCWGTGVCTNCNYSSGGACSERTCSNRCPDWESRIQKIDGYYSIAADVGTMKQVLVENGPLSVGLGMVGTFDSAGIYHCSDDSIVNHSTVIAGYDDASGSWIVKNSWGSTWNGDGYFKVGYGECGIERYAYQPFHIPPDYPKSDLVVTDLTLTPATPALNQPVNIFMTVKNQGQGSTLWPFYLYLFLDHDPSSCNELGVNQWLVPILGPGESWTMPSYTYDMPLSTDPHYFLAYADSDCDINEGENEDNNKLRVDFQIDTTEIFSDNFERGKLWKWTSCKTDSGDLMVTTDARLFGNFGLQALIDDNTAIFCNDQSPDGEMKYRARFYFHPQAIPMAGGDTHVIFQAIKDASPNIFRIEFRKHQTSYQIRAGVLNDKGSWKSSSWQTISNARHYIEFAWLAATAPGIHNGQLQLWIDGVRKANISNLDNDTHRVDQIHFGPSDGIDAGTRGRYFLDDFVSRRDNLEIGP